MIRHGIHDWLTGEDELSCSDQFHDAALYKHNRQRNPKRTQRILWAAGGDRTLQSNSASLRRNAVGDGASTPEPNTEGIE
ncbi:MAG: hypothetical protein M1511_03400 [Deltaproteobacteria bacterium]|nr:hypothetical protein [Deltaproteobacteria bacterium]